MFNEAPELGQEFPELKNRIHELKMRDTNFARQLDEYHDLVRQVHRIEQEIETPGDDVVEQIKKKRLELKDALYAQLAVEKA